MTRSERLLDLIQLLRLHRQPVTADSLALELGVSVRTIYRDMVTLQNQGAPIEGSSGVGYLLQPGFMLPPLMFTEEEIEALVLGSRWVAARTDDKLARDATNALAKIAAVLPQDLRERLDTNTLMVPSVTTVSLNGRELRRVREAIRTEIKIRIDYIDGKGSSSSRTVWPIAIGFFDQARVIVGWCESREAFRHFRLDRITHLELTAQSLPRRKAEMLREWRAIRDSGPQEHFAAHVDSRPDPDKN